jgi:hypothetical protein
LNKGFTLIETIAASLAACVAIASFGYLMNIGVRHLKQTNDISTAAFKAKGVMEQIRSVDFDEAISFNKMKFDNDKGIVMVSNIGPDLLIVMVNDRVTLATLRSRH